MEGVTVGSEEFSKLVGECRTVNVKVNGVNVVCLLDSGSVVTTITESFSFHILLTKGQGVSGIAIGWAPLLQMG